MKVGARSAIGVCLHCQEALKAKVVKILGNVPLKSTQREVGGEREDFSLRDMFIKINKGVKETIRTFVLLERLQGVLSLIQHEKWRGDSWWETRGDRVDTAMLDYLIFE